MNAKVSIIVPSFNKGKFIAETINSVITQSYQNWELIITDDRSTDNTVEIINAFCSKDERIKLFINSENKGANYSRNFGINHANGEYIIFLDADDLLDKECLTTRYRKINGSGFDFCVFTLAAFKNKIGDMHSFWRPVSANPLKDFLMHQLPWQTMQPIWRADFLKKLGGFDESFSRLQDVELHTRALLQENVKYDLINADPDCFYRVDEERLNYDYNKFLDRWIDSAVQYYLKFEEAAAQKNLKTKLNGTIYKTYLHLIYYFRKSFISAVEFRSLEKKLFSEVIVKKIGKKMLLINLSKWYNINLPRIYGINYIFNKLICR